MSSEAGRPKNQATHVFCFLQKLRLHVVAAVCHRGRNTDFLTFWVSRAPQNCQARGQLIKQQSKAGSAPTLLIGLGRQTRVLSSPSNSVSLSYSGASVVEAATLSFVFPLI